MAMKKVTLPAQILIQPGNYKIMKIIKNIVFLLVLSTAVFSCGTSRENYTGSAEDTTTVVKNEDYKNLLPYQDPDRLSGSVSPRSEEASPYQGSQSAYGPNDNSLLEPLSSRSTRSYNNHPTNYNNGGGDRGTDNTGTPGNNRY
jgi:hypothetical protein